jgi:hypothetical protein
VRPGIRRRGRLAFSRAKHRDIVGPMSANLAACRLADLLTFPVRPRMEEVLRRAARLLYAVGQPRLREIAIGAGYQRDHHRYGLYLYSFASRQRTYGEWLLSEELKPHRDPDEPELLGELEEIVDDLSRKAAVAVASCTSGDDRDEIMGAIFDENQLTPRTRFGKAKVRIALIRAIATWGVPGAAAAGQRLADEPTAMQLISCDGLLGLLRLSTREAPLDPERRADILTDVMRCENHLMTWLAEQKEKLQAHASEGELDQLGLGPLVPDMPLQTLRQMKSFLDVGEG